MKTFKIILIISVLFFWGCNHHQNINKNGLNPPDWLIGNWESGLTFIIITEDNIIDFNFNFKEFLDTYKIKIKEKKENTLYRLNFRFEGMDFNYLFLRIDSNKIIMFFNDDFIVLNKVIDV